MSPLRWLRDLLRRKIDVQEEIESHLRMAVAERVTRGESPETARREAMKEFGNMPLVADVTRERWGWMRTEHLMQDVRYALRTLKKDRGFALVAVLILALGIGANVVVFSVVNTVLLRPLPFKDAQQLVWLDGNQGVGGTSSVTYQVDAYEQFRDHNKSFSEVSGFVPFYVASAFKLTGYGEPKPVAGVWVMSDFPQTLGIQPMLGRTFTPEEALKGSAPVVLLSYPYWRSQFNGDRSIVGRAITLDGKPVTVVGLLPQSFDFGSIFAPGTKTDLLRAIHVDDVRTWGHFFSLVGRLKPGVTPVQAQAEATLLFPQLRDALKEQNWSTDANTKITGLKEHVSGELRRSLIILWCAVGLILLIVCVNLSNLLLARVVGRSKEFAMRTALGASRGRIMRQLLTESLVLSGIGALLGLGIAYGAVSSLAHQRSLVLPLLNMVRVDGTTLLWALAIAIGTAVLFGVVPAFRTPRGNLQEFLKDSGHGMSSGRRQDKLRTMLVVSEIVLSCVLLVGAGLLLRSFLKVLDVDLGFEPSHTAALAVSWTASSGEEAAAMLHEMTRRIGEIPGVEAVAYSDALPMEHNRSWALRAKGKTYPQDADNDAFVSEITPGYFRAMGMRIVAGRDFAWTDLPKSTHVIVINEATARRDWPGQDPVGKIAQGIGDGDTTVIGVVENIHESSVEGTPNPGVYVPAMQFGSPAGSELIVRTSLPLESLAPSVMSTLRSMNPGQPATAFLPLQTLVDHSTSPRRFFAVLVGLFAGLGLLLASLGIYGVISYTVTQQTQEIGIRMALGATPERVQSDVLMKTLRIALIGMAIGTAASFVVAKAISSMLFETQPTDPITFVGMAVVLTGAALFAGYIPARRASRVDPMRALRSE
jgi:predicted permease